MGTPDPLSRADRLARLLAVEPAALPLPPRLVRRAAGRDRGLSGLGLLVPHADVYWIDRDRLPAVGLPPAPADAPARVLLVADRADRRPAPAVLRTLWRRLFHAAVDRAIDGKRLTAAEAAARLAALGPTAAREAVSVLESARRLPPPPEAVTVYREFAALYLELLHFRPGRLADTFPALPPADDVLAVLAADLDPAALLAASRPEGATTPEPPPEDDGPPPYPPLGHGLDADRRLLAAAALDAARGNAARAAVTYERAGQRPAAADQVARLAGRLQKVLGWDEVRAGAWREALVPLTPPAARGTWPAARRVLHDLQAACLDLERDLYAVDLAEWGLSLGRRPVKRLLTCPREVRVLRHLRAAADRLHRAGLGAADRDRLEGLFRHELYDAEHRLRASLRPKVAGVLAEVGLRPANVPEEVARAKLTEELLDRAAAVGFLSFGDLRDAVARNQLKLGDLPGPLAAAFDDDPLLRADLRLADELDGVYRRGEVYLRLLQRLSSLAFGTPTGRVLTMYLVVPFGAAFVGLEGVQHLMALAVKGYRYFTDDPAPPPESPHADGDGDGDPAGFAPPTHAAHEPPPVELVTWLNVLVLGLAVVALIHSPLARRVAWDGLTGLWRLLRGAVYDGPAWVLTRPYVRPVWDNPATRFARDRLLAPALLTVPAYAGMRLAGLDRAAALPPGAVLFGAVALLCNTRLGRDAQETAVEWLLHTWRIIRVDLVLGLVNWLFDIIRWLTDQLERGIYAVDEWLRFRGGDSAWSLAVKAALGLVWSAVAYVVRVYVTLLIEPQVNPIKHFPVVTVAHKVMIPFLIDVFKLLVLVFVPLLGFYLGGLAAGVTLFLLPGVFGFLVWELKENRKLYRAGRPATLRPVMVGHHGETVKGLLRPGLHSGTVPKLYARLRRGGGRAARASLEHAAEAVRHFAERELVALLRRSERWAGLGVRVGGVRLATHLVAFDLVFDGADRPLAVAFEFDGGRVVARLGPVPGGLTPGRRAALADALAGFYHLADADALAGGTDWRESHAVAWGRWVAAWEADRAGGRRAFAAPEGLLENRAGGLP